MTRGSEEQSESVREFSNHCLQPLQCACEARYRLKDGHDLSVCFTTLLTWQISSDTLFYLK